MNMFARFDENPAMTLRVIKETKRYGRTDAQTDGRTDNVKTVYPLQTKFAGGIIIFFWECILDLAAVNKKYPQWDSSLEHPKHMLKLMGKKIFTILSSKILFIWTCVHT